MNDITKQSINQQYESGCRILKDYIKAINEEDWYTVVRYEHPEREFSDHNLLSKMSGDAYMRFVITKYGRYQYNINYISPMYTFSIHDIEKMYIVVHVTVTFEKSPHNVHTTIVAISNNSSCSYWEVMFGIKAIKKYGQLVQENIPNKTIFREDNTLHIQQGSLWVKRLKS